MKTNEFISLKSWQFYKTNKSLLIVQAPEMTRAFLTFKDPQSEKEISSHFEIYVLEVLLNVGDTTAQVGGALE